MNEKETRTNLIALINECKAETNDRWQRLSQLQARYELARTEWCNADRMTRRLLKLAGDIGVDVETAVQVNPDTVVVDENKFAECQRLSDR